MQRFKNILLVAENTSDFSPAFVRAGELAERNGAVVTVIHVLEALPRDVQILASAVPLDDTHRHRRGGKNGAVGTLG